MESPQKTLLPSSLNVSTTCNFNYTSGANLPIQSLLEHDGSHGIQVLYIVCIFLYYFFREHRVQVFCQHLIAIMVIQEWHL